MPLRVRCPQCRTVLEVPAGVKPRCPRCGFAGHGVSPTLAGTEPAAAPAAGVKFTRMQAATVEWGEPGEAAGAAGAEWGAEQWPEQDSEWPAGEEAGAPAGTSGASSETADEWAQAPTEPEWAPADPPAGDGKKRRGWGRR